MPYRAMRNTSQRSPTYKTLKISKFAGINFSYVPTEIADNQSPDLLNIQVTSTGSLERRYGFKRIYATSLGAGKINGLYEYNNKFIIAWGTNLYTQTGSNQPVSVYGSLANAKTKFFKFNNLLYLINGTNYMLYNGSTVSDVAASSYIPVIDINRKPDGSNYDLNQDRNLLSGGFTDSFNADGTSTVYHLMYGSLDADLVVVVYNNVTYTEGVSFTVNRTAGTVDFSGGSSPLGALLTGTNNVLITAYKVVSGNANLIKNCRFFAIYGGQNDTRIFLSGNVNNPNTIYYSEVFRPNYFPENNFINVGSNAEKIMGFTLQYDTLIIHKENSKWNMKIEFDTNGKAYFPLRPINDAIGCAAEDSIQIIQNNPVTLTRDGVYELTGSGVRDERNARLFSQNIDNKLKTQSDLSVAISADFDQKYYLIFPNADSPGKSYGYIYDYVFKEWFLWDDMHFSCLYISESGNLMAGDLTNGLIYQFSDIHSSNAYSDDGSAYNSYWKSKIFNFGTNNFRKIVESIFYSLKAGFPSSADLYYFTEDYTSPLVQQSYVNAFSYQQFNYAKFTYLSSIFPKEFREKIKEKKIIYLQLMFQNNRNNESMTIINIDLKYMITQEVK